VDYHVPFGGRKGSSYGPREQGRCAAEFDTTVKTAYTFEGSGPYVPKTRAECVPAESERVLSVIGDARSCAKNRYPPLRNVL
jgi:hypothetical protein